jgi:hypothetical protein
MQSLKDFIDTNIIAEDILSASFTEAQIEAAEYFDITELADGNYRLCIYHSNGSKLGHIDSSDVDSLVAYVEEEFEVDEEDIEIDMYVQID